MGSTLRNLAASCQSKPLVGDRAELSTDVANALALLRTCVHERGWTLEALEEEMDVDKSQISRVLNGERPLTLSFLTAMPDDIESLYEARRTEAFGMIVVAPVHGDQAVRNLVSGLFGVLGAKLAPEPRS